MTIFVQKQSATQVYAIEQFDGLNLKVFKELLIGNDMEIEEVLVFEEGGDEPITEEAFLALLKKKQHPKVHVHRHLKVEVLVYFNGQEAKHQFSPSKTVAAVKAWADEKFRVDPSHAAEHVLQLHGTLTRPSPSTHIGSLTQGHACVVAFDLVPNERIQG
ncbi:hypothetical protein ACKI2N_015630 [Cupriavidus sp. 30B13]|uniref:hypothetical protein n=1 Tax=Cupriavidus sp. 30B13 TaxID=3384241 RepID=UPI003B90DFFC